MKLVTAVMVTGKHPERQPFADAAIRSFEQQDYPKKQLVIISDAPEGPETYMGRTYNVCTKLVFPGGKRSLGELRNEGLREADGEYIVQWDDDDWRHPTCVSYMMEYAQQNKALTLQSQLRYSFRTDCGYAYRRTSGREGICGTVLHHNRPGLGYESIGQHEDCRFLKTHFPGELQIIDNRMEPHLYLRFYHGNNTWDEDHIMQRYSQESLRGKRIMPQDSEVYLKEVLEKEYIGCVSL